MFRYISQQREIIRSYYSGIGKTGLTCVAAFAVAVGLGQIILGLVFYVREVFDATAGQVGALAGTWAICYAVGCLFVRPVFRRFQPRHLIIMATASVCVFTMTMRFVPSLAWIFVLQALNGVSLSLFWPPLMGWLSSDLEGKALNKAVMRFNLSWCSGNVVSPFIAGWLSDISVGLPLYCASGIYLLTAVFVAGAALVLPRTPVPDNSNNNENGKQAKADASTLQRYPAWVGLFSAYFATGLLLTLFPIIGRDLLFLNKRTIGTMLMARSLINAGMFILLGRTVFWHFRSMPMLLGQLLGIAAFVGLVFMQSTFGIVAMLCLFGISLATSYSNSIFHGVSGSTNRAGRMAIHESILAAGFVIGPVIGGWVYQTHAGFNVYWLAAMALFVSVCIQAGLCLWARRHKERNSE